MDDLQLEGSKLKSLVKLGKNKALSFAFCMGNKDDHTFLIHKKFEPKKLGQKAREISGNQKSAFGTFELKGQVMELTCVRVVPKMAKSLKKYLKNQKIGVNVVILDENGNTLESDVEDLPNDPTMDDGQGEAAQAVDAQDDGQQDGADAAEQTNQPSSDPSAAELAARLKALQPAIAAAGADTAAKLTKVMTAAVSQIKSGILQKADTTISALETAVAKLGDQAAQPAEGASDPEEPAAAPGGAEPDIRALAARANALKEVISGIADEAGEKLTRALGGAVTKIKARELQAADALLTKIEAAANSVMAGPGQDQGPPPEAAKWEAAQNRLQPAVDKAMSDKRGDLDAINRAFGLAKERADAGDYQAALKAAAATAELLKQAATATGTAAASEAADAAPDNVADYVKSRLAWIQTRSDLRTKIGELKTAIDTATAGIDGLEDVPAKSGALFDYLEGFDTELETTLEKLVETPDGDDREQLKSEARRAIASYRDVLDTDFFKAVDDNGFNKTDIRAGALASLQNVSAALDK